MRPHRRISRREPQVLGVETSPVRVDHQALGMRPQVMGRSPRISRLRTMGDGSKPLDATTPARPLLRAAPRTRLSPAETTLTTIRPLGVTCHSALPATSALALSSKVARHVSPDAAPGASDWALGV